LLIVLLNKAAKLSSDFLSLDKEYITMIKLGITTDSYDMDGKIIKTCSVPAFEKKYLSDLVKDFRGDYRQTVPAFSAKKFKGKHLYEYARKNLKTDEIKNNVRINKINIIRYRPPDLYIRLEVSSGTYIRAIANDIGDRLGCGAAMAELERVRIGSFSVKDALKAEEAIKILNEYNNKKTDPKKISGTGAFISVKDLAGNYKKIYVKEKFLKDLEMNSPLYEKMLEPGLNAGDEFEPGQIVVIKLKKSGKSYIHRLIAGFNPKEISLENKKLSKSLSMN
jgi:tRNA pseudouridine(55) synthase